MSSEIPSEINETVDRVKKGFSLIDEGMKSLSGGPNTYYLELLLGYARTLFKRFAPFKIGDRVEITEEIDFVASPGWAHSKHFLKPGARGTVREVNCYHDIFTASVEFDDESWIGMDGKINLADPQHKHVYLFCEKKIRKLL